MKGNTAGSERTSLRGSGAIADVRLRRSLPAFLLTCVLGTLMLSACVVCPAQNESAPPAVKPLPRLPEYRLGPGDEISVTFPLNAELNHDGPIGPDGRFTMTLVGSLYLAGDTVAEATLHVANAMRENKIVADARPSLTIRHYAASIYVGGEVRTPGMLQLSAGMDALQAIIAAGGMLDTAKTTKVAIIRRTGDGHAAISYIDLHAYLRGDPVSRIPLETRDVVFVPKSSIAEADRWVDQYLNRLLPFGRSLNYNLGNYASSAVVEP